MKHELIKQESYRGHIYAVKMLSRPDYLQNTPWRKFGLNTYWFTGYVELPVHLHYAKGDRYHKAFESLSVHGGLTWAGYLNDVHCELPRVPGLGFDCNHYQDNPLIQNAAYVEQECKQLIDQIIRLGD